MTIKCQISYVKAVKTYRFHGVCDNKYKTQQIMLRF